MTEEEVKVRIVLPFLTSAGIEPADLQLETTFTLRLGRQLLMIDGTRERDATGRLDILVQRNNRNLLIVETKREDLALTDDDRDQAISYARLLDQIAPYALVTNGADWRLYDVLTKEQVTAADVRVPDGYAIALPDDLKYDALRLFLRASPDNVRLLCQHQVQAEIAPLLGSAADRTKAYIPELQIVRSDLAEALERFYQDRKPLFALVGESGSGKTCSLCTLVLSQAAASKPVFFFKAIMLEHGIADALAAEFNWTFTDAGASDLQVLKRLHDFDFGSPVTLIVDAIDEWPYPAKVANLLWLANHADPNRLRLVVSCKAETWPSFLTQRGTPTGLEALVYDPKRTDRREGPVASHIESGFNDPEFHVAVGNYRRFFDYAGTFDEATLGEAQRNPALLRVLFEVAGETKPPHLSLSASSVLEQYIGERIRRMARPEQARHAVTAVASALFDQNTDWIREDELRQALGLGPSDRIEPDLFEHSVLARRGPGFAPDIGFALAEVRDFMITDVVRRWPTLDAAAFAAAVAALQPAGLHVEVLRSYYRRAPEAQKRVIDGDVFEAAQRYLQDYADILQRHFPRLWRSFPGCGTGAPGFYGEFNVAQRRVHFHGFRRQAAGTPSVILHGVDNFDGDRVAAYSFQVETLQWAGNLVNDPADLHRKVVNNEIVPALEKLVTTGSLNEDATPDLILELLLGAIWRGGSAPSNAPIIGTVFGAFWDPKTRRPRFPVTLDAILESFRRQELRRQIDSEVVEERRTHPSFFQYTPEVLIEIDRRLEEAVARGDVPSEHRKFMDIERLKKWLPHAIDVLRQNIRAADPSRLPVRPSPEALGRAPTREDWEAYLRDLYARYLSNYRALVETNFPTLKDTLPLYKRMPMRQYIALDQIRGPNEGAYVTILTCTDRPEANELIIARTITPKDARSMVFTVDGQDVEAELFSRPTEPGPMASGPNPLGDRIYGTPLRQLVYGTLQREFKTLLAAFRVL